MTFGARKIGIYFFKLLYLWYDIRVKYTKEACELNGFL